MKLLKSTLTIAGVALLSGSLLFGCGAKDQAANQPDTANEQQAENAAATDKAANEDKSVAEPAGAAAGFAQAVEDLAAELEKGKDGGQVDWDKAAQIYNDQLKSVVAQHDSVAQDEVNNQLEAAMTAGKEGTLSAGVVNELHEKLLLKVAFFTVRNDLKEIGKNLTDKAAAKTRLDEVNGYFDGMLNPFITKRDNAYGTQIVDIVSGALADVNAAVGKGDSLAFNLARQVIDKSVMKAVYLATGAEQGYGYKLEKLVAEGSDKDIKAEQAEAWAYFQSLIAYLSGHAEADANYINTQFGLSNDPANIKGDLINQAFVRAFALTAKSEYTETFENWGTDKASITAMEGLLFIDVVNSDLAKALGSEEKGKALMGNAQNLLNEVKNGNKDQATNLYKLVEADLNQLANYGK